jgi:hypothetical protein
MGGKPKPTHHQRQEALQGVMLARRSWTSLATARQAKRAIILLRMDWHSAGNRALLRGPGAAETRFWLQPRRAIYLGGVEVVRRMASRTPLRIP